MNAELHQRALALMVEVMDLPEPERQQRIDRLCGQEPGLRELVMQLLGRVPDGEAALPTGGLHRVAGMDLSGARLGPYQLERLLGIGGMGSVYLAWRDTGGVRQQVALKVMNLQPAPEELARFAREQQALASLHHPYIAAFIDLGVTDQGVRYFVMEYVPGVPIGAYCASHRLTIEQRLTLWLKVCEAVHHAHQNLVVHRDIKPANILVTEDGLPKLLDFGIARLLNEGGGKETTRFARHLTLDYATPERVLRNVVSTSEDVYALGVLLYELIAGARPFHRSALTFEALLASIGDTLPPSLREAYAGLDRERRAEIAAERRLTQRQLLAVLKGDLQSICEQSLHPDANRRYGSALQFGEDVQRFLRTEPVHARGDSRGYRLRRFVSRHRLGLFATFVTTMALLVALAVSVYQTSVATTQARRAMAVNEFLRELLAAPNARWDSAWRGHADLRMSELLELASGHLETRLSDQPEVRVELHSSLARSFVALSMLDRAVGEQRKALATVQAELAADSWLHPRMRTTMATMLDYVGTPETIAEAREHLQVAIAWLDRHAPGPGIDRTATLGELGYSHHVAGEYPRAIEIYLESERSYIEAGGDMNSPLLALGYGLLGMAHIDNHQFAQAKSYLDESLTIYDRYAERPLADAANAYGARALLHLSDREFEPALSRAEQALVVARAVEAGQSLALLGVTAGVASSACAVGAVERCAVLLEDARRLLAKGMPGATPIEAGLDLTRAELMIHRGDARDALRLLETIGHLRTVDKVRSLAGPNVNARWFLAMGRALVAIGDPDGARPHIEQAIGIFRSVTGYESAQVVALRDELAALRSAPAPG